MRDEMVDVFDDCLVAAEAGCEGELGSIEVALDVIEGFRVCTGEGLDGLMAITDCDEAASGVAFWMRHTIFVEFGLFQHLNNRE